MRRQLNQQQTQRKQEMHCVGGNHGGSFSNSESCVGSNIRMGGTTTTSRLSSSSSSSSLFSLILGVTRYHRRTNNTRKLVVLGVITVAVVLCGLLGAKNINLVGDNANNSAAAVGWSKALTPHPPGSGARERNRLFAEFVRRSSAASTRQEQQQQQRDNGNSTSELSSSYSSSVKNRFLDFLSSSGERLSESGIVIVDKPVHFGGDALGERKYIEQMGGMEQTRELEKDIASGLRSLFLGTADNAPMLSRNGPILELGAGQGTMSRPIVSALGDVYPYVVLSDTSAGFLEYTKDTLSPKFSDNTVVEYVTLGSLQNVPNSSVSLLALRYVMHHIPDWKGFIRDAARVLLPGGVLLMEEPIADGFFVQRAIISSCLETNDARRIFGKSRRVQNDLEYFVNQIGIYLRTDLDKSKMEDKHLFSQHELYHACQDAGMSMRLFPNQGLDHLAAEATVDGRGESGGGEESKWQQNEPTIRYSSFSSEFRHNFVQNFQFGHETVEFFDKICYPTKLRDAFESVDGTVNGPVVKGVIFAIKI